MKYTVAICLYILASLCAAHPRNGKHTGSDKTTSHIGESTTHSVEISHHNSDGYNPCPCEHLSTGSSLRRNWCYRKSEQINLKITLALLATKSEWPELVGMWTKQTLAWRFSSISLLYIIGQNIYYAKNIIQCERPDLDVIIVPFVSIGLASGANILSYNQFTMYTCTHPLTREAQSLWMYA